MSSSRVPLADQVYERLLDQLMDGRRVAGEPLNISVLSKEFDVSQTPLREALARLEHSGLVYRQALKGYYVAVPFTPDEIVKLTDVRVLMEGSTAREAALRRTPEFIDELMTTVHTLESVADGADTSAVAFRQYWSSDDRFHNLIAAQSGNPFLVRTYEVLSLQIQRFRLFTNLGDTSAAAAAAEHTRIVDALRRGDADGAQAAMVEHVESARDRAVTRSSPQL